MLVDEEERARALEPVVRTELPRWMRALGPAIGVVLLIGLIAVVLLQRGDLAVERGRTDAERQARTETADELSLADEQLQVLFAQISAAQADTAALREQLAAAIEQIRQLGGQPVVDGDVGQPAARRSSAPAAPSGSTPPTTPPTTTPPDEPPPDEPPDEPPPLVCVLGVCTPG